MIQVVRQSNSVVTDYYLDVITQMCSDGEDIFDRTHQLNDCSRDDIVIVPTASDFLHADKCGFRKVVIRPGALLLHMNQREESV